MKVPSKQVYEAGYAICVYDMRENVRTFRFKDEELSVSEAPREGGPHRWYFVTEYEGWPVAKWEDVKRVHASYGSIR